MTRGTLDDPSGAGRLRTEADNVNVIDVRSDAVLFTPPPASQLPERLEKLIAYANAPSSGETFVHPLVKAAVLHFWLAYEHAFIDGNGRTARAVFFWFMLKNGYWLFEYLTVSRAILKSPAGYYRSFLYSEHDDEDLTYSLLYQLDATKRALADLRAYLEVKQEERALLPERLRAIPDANPRQRSLLDHALRNPDSLITFAGHARTHGVTLVTARSDVLELLARKLLREVGTERPRSFLPAQGLAVKLSKAPRLRGARR
jgi:Fic family protein